MRCFGAILWLHLSFQTNLEILVFLSVGVAHMSFQFTCVEETLRAGCEFASGERKSEAKKVQIKVVCACVRYSNSADVTYDLLELFHSFVLKHVATQVGFPRETTTAASSCALTRALRIDFIMTEQVKHSPACSQQTVDVTNAFEHAWTTSLPLRCAPCRALSVSTPWWKWPRSRRGRSWTAAGEDHLQVSHCEHRSFRYVSNSAEKRSRHGEAAALTSRSYSLLAKVNWMIGGARSPGVESQTVKVKLKLIHVIDAQMSCPWEVK